LRGCWLEIHCDQPPQRHAGIGLLDGFGMRVADEEQLGLVPGGPERTRKAA